MSISFACSHCKTKIAVDDTAAGKRGKCRACGEVLTVPNIIRKMCSICGIDVSQQKRTKDAEGRYYCEPCWANLSAPSEDEQNLVSSVVPSNNVAEPATVDQFLTCPDCGSVVPISHMDSSGVCMQCAVACPPSSASKAQQTVVPKKAKHGKTAVRGIGKQVLTGTAKAFLLLVVLGVGVALIGFSFAERRGNSGGTQDTHQPFSPDRVQKAIKFHAAATDYRIQDITISNSGDLSFPYEIEVTVSSPYRSRTNIVDVTPNQGVYTFRCNDNYEMKDTYSIRGELAGYNDDEEKKNMEKFVHNGLKLASTNAPIPGFD